MKVANTMEIRLQNAFYIMREIEGNPGITNTEIAQMRGLSVPTISNIVNILKNSKLVMTTGTGESSGGRRPIQLSLNPKCQYSIGVSISRHTVYVVLIDFEGHIYEKQKYYIQFAESDEYWKEIQGLIEQMQEMAPIPCEVGVALPGLIDYEKQVATNMYTLGVPTVSLESVYRILGDHVSIGDSCRLAARAQVFAKNNIVDNFFILLSRRVSGILFHSGNILNFKVSSLDVGAMIIDLSDESTTFGTSGSFLSLCSASRIIEIIKKEYSLTSYEEFFEGIDSGNQDFIEIWDNYLRKLAVAIYNIYAVSRVDIVIGGEMAKYIEPYAQKLKDYVCAISPDNTTSIRLYCSIYGEYDDAYGAALEARSSYLDASLPEILKNSVANVPSQTKKKGKSKK